MTNAMPMMSTAMTAATATIFTTKTNTSSPTMTAATINVSLTKRSMWYDPLVGSYRHRAAGVSRPFGRSASPRREGLGAVRSAFSALHPKVASWAQRRLGHPTQPQAAAIPSIVAGRTVLVASPTGTGKTLAAFLPQFSRLAERIDRDELYPRPFVLYVSPLRALGYDIEHNARRPLREMELLERPGGERAERRRGRLRERAVRTGVRTGDTPQTERRLMLQRPPHLLITTPESLALMLALRTYRDQLRHVECVIVDEIHALAPNKRGAQLA
ncbi:DEAD/DEAH box helicase, partial [bacterium]